MDVIRYLEPGRLNEEERQRGCVLTIGNFDGIHLGHQAIIRQVKLQAKRLQCASAVMVFEPQPREFFNVVDAPGRLMTLRSKLDWFKHLGIDRVVALRFDSAFSEWTPQLFVKRIMDALAVKHWVIGDDFRFGNDRSGDLRFLQRVKEHYGFSVENSASYMSDGNRVSSTWIRRSLTLSRFDEAERLLGHPYFISGRVTHGDKLGRQLGAPTANIGARHLQLPISGVFAVDVAGVAKQPMHGVAHIGYRPTVNGREPRVEVHVLDYSGDLYGKRLGVRPRERLRKEQKFVNLDALKHQIRVDIANARGYFSVV
jgi:riboflavin kinase / FMN adenylyltransferase